MSETKVRIGFVGVGGMGQCAHLKNYVTVPECEVVAIAELKQDMARRVAARYGIPKVYKDHKEMFAAEKLDAVVASQPFSRHCVLVSELAQARIPIFTEKPLAATIEAGQKILEALSKHGTWHMVGYHKRSDPATMYAKDQIEKLKQSGELGRMTYVRILIPAGDWVANGFTDLIRSNEKAELAWDPPASDMNKDAFDKYVAFVNYYIHQVNLMRHLLGEPYQVTYADPSGVLLAGRSASGVACTIEMSPYVTSIDWQEQAFVAFQRGWIRVDLPAPLASNRPGKVTMFRDPKKDVPEPVTIEPQMPWVHAMRQQAINFVRAVKGEIKPMCDAAEALEDLKVARDYLRLWKGV